MQSVRGNVKKASTRKWRPVTKSGDGDDKVATREVKTLHACLLWAAGVMEVVAGITGQCGSKSDAKRQGEREKGITTQKWRQVTKSGDSDDKVATVTTKWR